MPTKIIIIQGDITQLQVDAIVNAANSTLLGGGGVDGAIHAAAGKELLKECKELGKCEIGQAKITKGYKLPAKNIIHTVGPVYGDSDGKEEELLASCYTNSLRMAKNYSVKTIAFPAISTGAYGYPQKQAASIAMKTIRDYIEKNPKTFDEIHFVLFDKLNHEIYSSL